MTATYPGITGDINVYMKVLRAICGDTDGKSMVDLGCCFAPNTPKLGFSKRTYMDVLDRKLDHTDEQQFFVQQDIITINPLLHERYDVSMALDVIEHFSIEEGEQLLLIMKHLSHKQIIFTPTTALFGIARPENDDPEAHRSVWSPEMLKGYASIVFPDFHPSWSSGGFFSWHCQDIEKDFERVINLIQL